MKQEQAAQLLKKINDLWPEWGMTGAESVEWTRAISHIDDYSIAENAVSKYYEAGSKYKRPALPDFLNVVRKLWREEKAKHTKNTQPVLHYTIAREKAQPGRIQVGHQYWGKPGYAFQDIERSAQKALSQHGDGWIIVYPPEKTDFERENNL
jgi:hypothetical protein